VSSFGREALQKPVSGLRNDDRKGEKKKKEGSVFRPRWAFLQAQGLGEGAKSRRGPHETLKKSAREKKKKRKMEEVA